MQVFFACFLRTALYNYAYIRNYFVHHSIKKITIMSEKDLLKTADAEFEKEFGKTPKELGFLKSAIYNDCVVYFPTQKEYNEFIKGQSIIAKTYRNGKLLLITVVLYFIATMSYCYALNINSLYFIIAGTILSIAAIIYIAHNVLFRIKKIEKSCREKLIVYEKD